MPYLTSYQNAGDPGLFSALGGALSGFVSGGPLGAIRGGISGFRSRGRPQPPGGGMVVGVPGMRGAIQRAVPGGKTGLMVAGQPRKKRRRMNYGNTKALRRASRRMDGFVKEAKRALKHTNYKIVSKSAGKSKPKMVINERGPGNVVVR